MPDRRATRLAGGRVERTAMRRHAAAGVPTPRPMTSGVPARVLTREWPAGYAGRVVRAGPPATLGVT